MAKRLTEVEVLIQFENIHGDMYDYSKFRYVRDGHKSSIICRIHGLFTQSPETHKRGQGCPECVGRGLNTKKLIQQFRNTHGNRFDYSEVKYSKTNNKVKIKCHTHGFFTQSHSEHKTGAGCKKCSNKYQWNTEEIIKQFKDVHGSKYGYNNVKYTRALDKVSITCFEHGEFSQTPNDHKAGRGCPSCGASGFKPSKSATLYYIKIDDVYKIGITNHDDLCKRYSKCDMNKIEVIKQVKYQFGADAKAEERRIIQEFKEFKYKGPQILSQTGITEMFNVNIINKGLII